MSETVAIEPRGTVLRRSTLSIVALKQQIQGLDYDCAQSAPIQRPLPTGPASHQKLSAVSGKLPERVTRKTAPRSQAPLGRGRRSRGDWGRSGAPRSHSELWGSWIQLGDVRRSCGELQERPSEPSPLGKGARRSRGDRKRSPGAQGLRSKPWGFIAHRAMKRGGGAGR